MPGDQALKVQRVSDLYDGDLADGSQLEEPLGLLAKKYVDVLEAENATEVKMR